MILDSLLAGAMLFGSYAIRTPNEQPNPDDYEVSIGLTHEFFYANRQWEQELGTSYIDDLLWLKADGAGVYFKPEYMNKQSKDIKYVKIDWRKSLKIFTWGLTTRSTTDELDEYETFASIGMNKKEKYRDDKIEVEITFDGYLPPDESGDNSTFEYENKFKVSWKLTDRVRLYNLGEVSYLKDTSFYKGKIGVEVTL
ncbi:MAG: hypothetical protein H8E12_20790 [Rhodobacteraceae bacterium]|nr:hypothetical protein [Paracoccaceae bacterium]